MLVRLATLNVSRHVQVQLGKGKHVMFRINIMFYNYFQFVYEINLIRYCSLQNILQKFCRVMQRCNIVLYKTKICSSLNMKKSHIVPLRDTPQPITCLLMRFDNTVCYILLNVRVKSIKVCVHFLESIEGLYPKFCLNTHFHGSNFSKLVNIMLSFQQLFFTSVF